MPRSLWNDADAQGLPPREALVSRSRLLGADRTVCNLYEGNTSVKPSGDKRDRDGDELDRSSLGDGEPSRWHHLRQRHLRGGGECRHDPDLPLRWEPMRTGVLLVDDGNAT